MLTVHREESVGGHENSYPLLLNELQPNKKGIPIWNALKKLMYAVLERDIVVVEVASTPAAAVSATLITALTATALVTTIAGSAATAAASV